MAAKRILDRDARKNRPGQAGKKGAISGLCTRNHPLCYVPMENSGWTTVKNLMYFLDTGSWYPDPMAIHGDREAFLRNASSATSSDDLEGQNKKVVFTFVREPFARAYSCFNRKIFHQGPNAFPRVRKLLAQRYGAAFPVNGQDYSTADHGRNFLSFLRFTSDSEIKGTPMEKAISHWMPQKKVLDSHRNRMNIDFVGRIENFAQGMQFVLDLAKIDVPVDFNVRFVEDAHPRFTLQEIMTDEIYDGLSEIYAVDLKYFGYKDEYGPAK